MSYETLRRWIAQDLIDHDRASDVTTEAAEEIRRLNRENAELRRAVEILKPASDESPTVADPKVAPDGLAGSRFASTAIRVARSFNSSEYFLGAAMTPILPRDGERPSGPGDTGYDHDMANEAEKELGMMRRSVAGLILPVFLLASCTAYGTSEPSQPEVTAAPSVSASARSIPASVTPSLSAATRSPWAAPTPGPDGKVPGYYPGVRLRFIPRDPATTLSCRPITKAERALLSKRGNRIDHPTKPVAVDLPEGWALVASWGSNGGSVPYPTALLTDGGTYQELISIREPQDWPGTHTNAGIAWEDGPKALRAALRCIGADQ